MPPDKQSLRFRRYLLSIAVVAVVVSVALLAKEAVSLGAAIFRQAGTLLPHRAVALHANGEQPDSPAGTGRVDYLPEHLHPAKDVDQSDPPTF